MDAETDGVVNEELWSDERIGRELNPEKPLTPHSVRREMSRAKIPMLSGRSARLVRALLARRANRGTGTDAEVSNGLARGIQQVRDAMDEAARRHSDD